MLVKISNHRKCLKSQFDNHCFYLKRAYSSAEQLIIITMNNIDRPIYQLDSNQLELVLAKLLDKKFEELIEKINKEEKIYTRDQASKILGVRPNTVSSYINKGILKNKGIARKVLISSKDIDRLLNKNISTFKIVA